MSEADTRALFEKAKEVAIKFYDNEHELDSEQRREVSTFFKTTTSTVVNMSGFGFVAGVALPFILKKKGRIVNPAYPVFFGVILSSFIPSIAAVPLFNKRLANLKDKYGDESAVCKAIENTPAPISKSYFWAGYFNKSSVDPSYRFTDPRKIDQGESVFVIDKTLADNQTAYKHISSISPTSSLQSSELSSLSQSPSSAFENTEISSAWDKVRNPSSSQQSTSSDYNYSGTVDDDILNSGLDLDNNPRSTNTNSGQSTTSAWDKVRQQNGTK